jgi:hypothetical protein
MQSVDKRRHCEEAKADEAIQDRDLSFRFWTPLHPLAGGSGGGSAEA